MGNAEHTKLQTNRKAKSKESASHINATLMNYIQQFPFQQSTIYHLNYSAPFCKKKHQIITTFTIYIYTKHKGKQKPYLKENRGCMGYKLEGR